MPVVLPDCDGDGLAVGQRHSHWRAGYRRADGRGVGDGATFSGRLGGFQGHGRGVDGVGDVGHCWSRAWHQVLEVAASGGGDRGADLAGVNVGIVLRRIDGHGTAGSVGVDGDHRAVAQRDGHWRAGSVGQGGGVDDRATFSDRVGGAQRQIGRVDGVSHGGADRRFVGHQVFVVAAADVGDRVGQRCVTGQRIVGCEGAHGTGGLPDCDGDGLAVGQGHSHWRAGYRRADGRGVSDGATFSGRLGGFQGHGRGVDGVGDVGHCWSRARHQVFEVAAGGGGDRGLTLPASCRHRLSVRQR